MNTDKANAIAQYISNHDQTARVISIEDQANQHRIIVASERNLREVTLMAMKIEESVWVQNENGAYGIYIARS